MSLRSNSSSRLPRGHHTLKSSALAPTAMSYMGQDFIANHMKSHYRRIMSAKAAVDTSPPKSMKAHIKVCDQRKRAALESRAGTPSSLRTRSPSVEFLSSLQTESSPLNSTRNWQSPGHRQTTGTPLQRSLSLQSLDRGYPLAVPSSSPRDMVAEGQISSPASTQLQSQPPVSPIRRQTKQSTTRKDHLYTKHIKKQIRTNLRPVDKSEQSTSSNLDGDVGTLLGTSYDESYDLKNPMAIGNITGEENLTRTDGFKHSNRSTRHGVPRLDLTDVQYSYRGPPSMRTSACDSTDFKANMWEEEQQYLKFISEVTTDILARGIFSNRVLKQVFEMHIERRKDKLDESRLREMIEQLKEDLAITES